MNYVYGIDTKETIYDNVLVDKRYRNAITNAKAKKDADGGSDHYPVWLTIKVKLKKQKKKKCMQEVEYRKT